MSQISENWQAELANRYQKHIQREGLKATKQRDRIVRHLFTLPGHHTVDDLVQEIRQIDEAIGLATVYRTLNLLKQAGLIIERQFQNQASRYEVIEEDHHDHLICTSCGKIVEFENEQIESLQEQVAKDQGFRLTDHRMELYGLCGDCSINR